MTRAEERKRWISVKADGRAVAVLEKEAQARGISRSEAVRRAVEQWSAEAMEADEERIAGNERRHRQVMNRLDYLIGMFREAERQVERQPGRTREGAAQAEAPAGGPDGELREPESGEGALAEARKRARRSVR